MARYVDYSYLCIRFRHVAGLFLYKQLTNNKTSYNEKIDFFLDDGLCLHRDFRPGRAAQARGRLRGRPDEMGLPLLL